MSYVVRVKHSSDDVETEYNEVETHDEAKTAYTEAVQKFDVGHTVSLFHNGVTVHEALGTGSDKLDSE